MCAICLRLNQDNIIWFTRFSIHSRLSLTSVGLVIFDAHAHSSCVLCLHFQFHILYDMNSIAEAFHFDWIYTYIPTYLLNPSVNRHTNSKRGKSDVMLQKTVSKIGDNLETKKRSYNCLNKCQDLVVRKYQLFFAVATTADTSYSLLLDINWFFSVFLLIRLHIQISTYFRGSVFSHC